MLLDTYMNFDSATEANSTKASADTSLDVDDEAPERSEIMLDTCMDFDVQGGEDGNAGGDETVLMAESDNGESADANDQEAAPGAKDNENETSAVDAPQPMESPDSFDNGNANLEAAMNEVATANG